MTDIVPVPNWGGVRQLETNEYATGGLNGNMNEQAKALAGQNMYSRLYAGLPFDPAFTAQVGGFPIGGKAALENGDIVRSIIANNNNDPDVDMTGWEFAQKKTQFSSIAELRAIENIETNEKVYLRGLVEGSELGFGDWYYDATDTTSADNGWFVVVTSNGKRLKRVNSDKVISIAWAGIADQGDLAIKWQDAIDYSDAIRIAKGQMFDSPVIVIPHQRYTMSKGVIHPPYLSSVFTGSTLIIANYQRNVSDHAIKLQSKNNTVNMYETENGVSFNKCLTTIAGKVSLRFTDEATASENRPSGIVSGNAVGSTNTYSVNCRVTDFEVQGFLYDHEILGKDSWCWRFENCKFHGRPDLGRYGVCTSSTTNTNSGERCTYINTFFRGILLNTPGMYLYFTECSFDFVKGSVFKVKSTATFQDIRLTNCHAEMFDDYFIDSEVVSFAEDVKFYIQGGHILANGTDIKASHNRVLFNGRQNVTMRDVFLECPVYSSKANLGVIFGTNGANLKFYNVGNSTGRSRVDVSKIISRKNNFIPDTIGAVLSNSVQTTNLESRNGNGMSAVTAVVAASPSLTTNCLKIHTNSTSAYAFISSREFVPVIAGRSYVSHPVIELADGTLTGVIKPYIDWYDRDSVFISRAVVSYTITLQEYISGAQVLWADRDSKLIPITHQSFIAPAGAFTAKHGVSFETLVNGADYYLHSVTLYDSIES